MLFFVGSGVVNILVVLDPFDVSKNFETQVCKVGVTVRPGCAEGFVLSLPRSWRGLVGQER
jgi:hypothetical protein